MSALARGAYDEYGACGMARRVCYVCVCSRLRVVGALLAPLRRVNKYNVAHLNILT